MRHWSLGGTRFETGKKTPKRWQFVLKKRFCSQIPVMSEEEAEKRIENLVVHSV